jgi:hypothetical protein
MSETPRRQASKTAQQPQQEQQKGPHPSIVLQEVHSMLSEQQETMRMYATMLEHITNELADLKSRVQTVQAQVQAFQTQIETQMMYEDEEDDEELEEQGDEGNEDVADQETATLPSSWMEEPEPEPRRRPAAQAADLTGPLPLILPNSPKAALRGKKGVHV